MRHIILILLTITFIGCSTLQFNDSEMTNLTISVAAKAVGIRAAESGFLWTDDLETFYQAIMIDDFISLDVAKMAESYIAENVDRLLAPDLIRLAKMVGFEFENTDLVATDNVDFEMLKIAAEGFRMAVLMRQSAGR